MPSPLTSLHLLEPAATSCMLPIPYGYTTSLPLPVCPIFNEKILEKILEKAIFLSQPEQPAQNEIKNIILSIVVAFSKKNHWSSNMIALLFTYLNFQMYILPRDKGARPQSISDMVCYIPEVKTLLIFEDTAVNPLFVTTLLSELRYAYWTETYGIKYNSPKVKQRLDMRIKSDLTVINNLIEAMNVVELSITDERFRQSNAAKIEETNIIIILKKLRKLCTAPTIKDLYPPYASIDSPQRYPIGQVIKITPNALGIPIGEATVMACKEIRDPNTHAISYSIDLQYKAPEKTVVARALTLAKYINVTQDLDYPIFASFPPKIIAFLFPNLVAYIDKAGINPSLPESVLSKSYVLTPGMTELNFKDIAFDKQITSRAAIDSLIALHTPERFLASLIYKAHRIEQDKIDPEVIMYALEILGAKPNLSDSTRADTEVLKTKIRLELYKKNAWQRFFMPLFTIEDVTQIRLICASFSKSYTRFENYRPEELERCLKLMAAKHDHNFEKVKKYIVKYYKRLQQNYASSGNHTVCSYLLERIRQINSIVITGKT